MHVTNKRKLRELTKRIVLEFSRLQQLWEMEDPEIVYCEVTDLKNNAQPTPQPSQNEEASILELLTANILQPRKIPAPRTHTVFTSRCTKCDGNSSSKTQAATRKALVTILMIWSVLFTVLYFTTNVNRKPFDENSSMGTNYSQSKIIVSGIFCEWLLANLSTRTMHYFQKLKGCSFLYYS